MAFELTRSYPRLWSLTQGVAMVVTDLHGDWDIYRRYRDRFIYLQAKGQADCLIFTGDLIHSEKSTSDYSLDIVLDVLSMRETYGDAIIYLCGNHEMPHIYSISLTRGGRVCTSSFEKAMVESGYRAEIIKLFKELPFYIRTQAGVSLAHAGAADCIAEPVNADLLFRWNHQSILEWAEEVMAEQNLAKLRGSFVHQHHDVPYAQLAERLLALSGPEDPRFDHLLRGYIVSGHPWFGKVLWPALFSRNEHQYGANNYADYVDTLLQIFSKDFAPQILLVAGHISINGGYQIIGRQLRLASGYHAKPQHDSHYLLFDTARQIMDMDDLLDGLGTVFNKPLNLVSKLVKQYIKV